MGLVNLPAVALLAGLAMLPMPASAQGVSAPAWGASVEGLRLGLSLVDDVKPAPVIEVTFENGGQRDALLNLGFMLGNGPMMVPQAIRLSVRGASFGTCELEYADRRFSHVGGRIDDLVVGLPRAARYVVRLPVRDFSCAARKQYPMPWPVETLEVVARFRGGPALSTNLDMQGMRLMPFWRGTLESGAVSLPPAPR
ncbi:hypothetical protein TBR22_A42610 [Luteitalea sp. TBR-22]|uniref:hypothetical protein n=1 Tax=Luteitalea sp. TBR-22 TaxID=2802971 RepID=UPI001AF707B4|nr:hypothetical protein [Luteitalea sp. TBR-22]BCS35035.1 hypothetical protein TBR22_A42610 [Luteitalea sp. TBR-22]